MVEARLNRSIRALFYPVITFTKYQFSGGLWSPVPSPQPLAPSLLSPSQRSHPAARPPPVHHPGPSLTLPHPSPPPWPPSRPPWHLPLGTPPPCLNVPASSAY